MTARTFAEVEPVPAEWIWEGRIPAGEVTLLCAPGGTGKSFLAADICARVSRGDVMPDGSGGAPAAGVALAGLEDSPEASTVHRLTAAGADLSNVLDCSQGPDGMPFSLDGDLPWIREVNDQAGGLRLVVIDTLSAASPWSLTSVATVRNKILGPLNRAARDCGFACLLVHHVTKSGSIAGSKALEDGVRSLLTVSRSASDPRVRSVRVHKSNGASDQARDVRYVLSGEGTGTRAAWLAEQDPSQAEGGQARVLLLLRNTSHAMTAQEIAMRTGMPYTSCRVHLHRLGKRGAVLSTGPNSYRAA
jgi:KaiC/GvpD/RAD55 family RecA-like ATPase